MQPAMPIGRDTAGLGLPIKDHPAAFVIARLVIDIALIILAHLNAFAGGKDLGAKGLAVPPCDKALEEIHLRTPFAWA
jgi:hypothetical protein